MISFGDGLTYVAIFAFFLLVCLLYRKGAK
jgi:hypothetical protein